MAAGGSVSVIGEAIRWRRVADPDIVGIGRQRVSGASGLCCGLQHKPERVLSCDLSPGERLRMMGTNGSLLHRSNVVAVRDPPGM